MFRIMFVCTGNTCRSSMAEGIMKNLIKNSKLEKDVYISSSGTGVNISLPASEHAVTVLEEIETDISEHWSRPITKELIEDSDLILGMTEAHKNHVLRIMPEAKDKTFTLIEYTMDGKKGDISDPYFMDLDTYRNIRDEIMKYLELLLTKIIGKMES